MKPRSRDLVFSVLLLVVAATGGEARAADDARWSISTLLGGYMPALSDLSDGLYQADFVGTADVIVREGGFADAGADQNEVGTLDFTFENPLPRVGIGALAGIEFQWLPNERHGFFFGAASWEKTSIGRVTDNLPLQQHFVSNKVISERRGDISYTEYTLGWRYNFWQRPRLKLYSRLSVHEVFDIDYREDFTFLFVESPVEDLVGVRRVIVLEAQTASLFMGQLGLGAEWFLRDWLSFGLEGGYMVGERKANPRVLRIRNDFLDNDAVDLNGLPFDILPDGRLGYLRAGATPQDVADPDAAIGQYRPVRLEFDGWRLQFRVNIYF